jgi:N-acetyl-anhydromuramyl-L-alanine amidase AmpD
MYLGKVHGKERLYLEFTHDQTEAVCHLVEYLCAEYGIKRSVCLAQTVTKTGAGVVGHYHLTKRKVDPGPAIMIDVAEHLART